MVGLNQKNTNKCSKSLYKGKVIPESVPNKSNIGFEKQFLEGTDIVQINDTLFILNCNNTYLVSFNIKGNIENNGFISVCPRIDGIEKKELKSCANTNEKYNEVSVSNTFLVKTNCNDIYLDFLVISDIFKFDIAGSISICECD